MIRWLLTRALRWRGHLGAKDRVLKVKSWSLQWGEFGLEWPCILIQRSIFRETITPCWGPERRK